MGPTLSVSCAENLCCGNVHIYASGCPTGRGVVDSFEVIVESARRSIRRGGPVSRGELAQGFTRFGEWFPAEAEEAAEARDAIIENAYLQISCQDPSASPNTRLAISFTPSRAPRGCIAFGPSRWMSRDQEAAKIVQFCAHATEFALNTSNIYFTGKTEGRTGELLVEVGEEQVLGLSSSVRDFASAEEPAERADKLAAILLAFEEIGGVKALLRQMETKLSKSDWHMACVVAGAISASRMSSSGGRGLAATLFGRISEVEELHTHAAAFVDRSPKACAETLLTSPISSLKQRAAKFMKV